MLTRGVILATTLTVGLVAGVSSSALAIALVPGEATGATQLVQAIAGPDQDPADGTSASFLASVPVTVTSAPIVLDGLSDESAPEVKSQTQVPPTEPVAPATESNSGSSSGGSSNGDSEQSAEDKAKEDKAKKDKAKKDKEAAEQAKKDKKAAEQAKKEAEDKAKKDKEAEESGDDDDEDDEDEDVE